MKIWTLIENTTCDDRLVCEHGLSLYIETSRHKILFDMGQSSAFADNAVKLGVDLAAVDIAVLSHGHNDHGGGLAKFLEINQKAPVYLNKYAFEPHYNAVNRYIGLDVSLQSSDRLVFTDDTLKIDEELTLHSCNERIRNHDMLTCGLNVMENGEHIPEDFRHEQYLLIREGERYVLITGCSHKGVLNIEEWFKPDVLIGGFHFMKLAADGGDADFMRRAAETLLSYPTRYYTGHCTGSAQYALLKSVMGEKLSAFSTGSCIKPDSDN